MNNLREVNDDILKDWLEFREETLLCQLSDRDYKYSLNFDKFCEKILRNVSKDNKQFVQSQLDKLYDDLQKKDSKTWEAFCRRFNVIKEFRGKSVFEYKSYIDYAVNRWLPADDSIIDKFGG